MIRKRGYREFSLYLSLKLVLVSHGCTLGVLIMTMDYNSLLFIGNLDDILCPTEH